MLHVRHIFISPGHNFFGNYGKPAGTHPVVEVPEVECVAGYGLRGDRFYGYRPEYKGQATFFATEIYDELRRMFNLAELPASVFRRNIISEGVDLNALIGERFTLQGVEFEGMEECRPCHWMDKVVAPGAEEWLKGRGGLRCRVLGGGWLRTG
ncbi:MAG: molybdenum cofactor biosysynthesis protein [Opitutae bacterium]|nr:molybdenum cofactor biosysynthesis protein [Opitutae bacterium]